MSFAKICLLFEQKQILELSPLDHISYLVGYIS